MSFNRQEVNEKLFFLIQDLEELIKDNNDIIFYLQSTPRSGQGMKMCVYKNEYIIPKKYM